MFAVAWPSGPPEPAAPVQFRGDVGRWGDVEGALGYSRSITMCEDVSRLFSLQPAKTRVRPCLTRSDWTSAWPQPKAVATVTATPRESDTGDLQSWPVQPGLLEHSKAMASHIHTSCPGHLEKQGVSFLHSKFTLLEWTRIWKPPPGMSLGDSLTGHLAAGYVWGLTVLTTLPARGT